MGKEQSMWFHGDFCPRGRQYRGDVCRHCQARSRGQRATRCRSATNPPFSSQPCPTTTKRLQRHTFTAIRPCSKHIRRLGERPILAIRINSNPTFQRQEEKRWLLFQLEVLVKSSLAVSSNILHSQPSLIYTKEEEGNLMNELAMKFRPCFIYPCRLSVSFFLLLFRLQDSLYVFFSSSLSIFLFHVLASYPPSL
jgi:hypothetical protein